VSKYVYGKAFQGRGIVDKKTESAKKMAFKRDINPINRFFSIQLKMLFQEIST